MGEGRKLILHPIGQVGNPHVVEDPSLREGTAEIEIDAAWQRPWMGSRGSRTSGSCGGWIALRNHPFRLESALKADKRCLRWGCLPRAHPTDPAP